MPGQSKNQLMKCVNFGSLGTLGSFDLGKEISSVSNVHVTSSSTYNAIPTFIHKDFACCSLASDENELVSLTDSEYTINALSVTSQLGQEALFEFPYNEIGTCAC